MGYSRVARPANRREPRDSILAASPAPTQAVIRPLLEAQNEDFFAHVLGGG
jgi:hypothetical protein